MQKDVGLTYETFLLLFRHASHKYNEKALLTLQNSYPDYYKQALVELIPPIPDWEESPFPILQLPPNYSPSIENMIVYLTHNTNTMRECVSLLYENLTSMRRRNIRTDEVIYIFNENELWEKFFIMQPTLSYYLKLKRISSLQELAARTQDYFQMNNEL